MLNLKHIAPLTELARHIRATENVDVPDFDPLDGGANAEVLLLFEKPGPMAAGSGFISRDNDDPTAEATFRFMQDIGLNRQKTLLWNAIPGWNGTRKVTRDERKSGAGWVLRLVDLLPKLKAIVLVGGNAQKLRSLLHDTGLPILMSDHPSPLVKARYPERWADIPKAWARVNGILEKHEMTETISLEEYVEQLRSQKPDHVVPDFDPDGPLEGARVMFLQMKPGKMGAAASNIVSLARNDDRIAQNTRELFAKAGLGIHDVLLWNVCPWYDGKREATPEDVAEGLEELKRLVRLLPKLETVVLVGKKAQQAEATLTALGIRTIKTALPSPQVKNIYPEMYAKIAPAWAEAKSAV